MNRLWLCIVLGIFGGLTASGQLLTVGNQQIHKDEFVRLYEKNTPNPTYSKKSLKEYLELLTTYLLKVQEAIDKNVERSPQVQRDLRNYAEQLAQPYLTDRDLLEKMLHEVYEYSSQDVHARQIWIRCSPYANPADTLAAYRTALRIRDRLVKGGDFEAVATEESEKSDVVVVGSRQEKQISFSDLRYFSVFAMPYSIEKYAFASKIGDYSMPLKTEMGYHIVQTLDRQPALGRINASQIFLSVPQDADEKEEKEIKRKADSLYYLITNGTRTFEEVARQYSDDKISAIRGGRMAEFNVTRVEPLFVWNLYKMPIEVVSRPFRTQGTASTQGGYHIVVIHNVSGVGGDFETMRPELLYLLQRNYRAELIQKSFINSLAKTYRVVEVKGALKDFVSRIDSADVDGFWAYEIDDYADSVLCRVGNRVITYESFGKYIEDVQMDYHVDDDELFMTFIERNYQRHIGDVMILCETDNLGKKHEQFNRDFNEYRDAILAYEITDNMVWAKSSEDTIGLYEYYDSQKHCYMWPARIQALIFKYDVRRVSTDNVQKFLNSSYRKRLSAEQIIEQANKNFDPRYISVTVNVYEPGQNKFTDRVDWTKLGLSRDIAAGGFEKGFVYIYHYYPSTCKSLEEVRGIMVEQYQQHLEKEWVKGLNTKYNVRVNEAEFERLTKN